MRGTQNKLRGGPIAAVLASNLVGARPGAGGVWVSRSAKIHSHDHRKGLEEEAGGNAPRKISNATLACRVVPVLWGERGGGGMIPFCCSFSPQNPVGTRFVQMGEQGVAVNMKAVAAY